MRDKALSENQKIKNKQKVMTHHEDSFDNTKYKNTWKMQIPPSVSCSALKTDKKTKKRVNKLTHKMNKCMTSMTFLVLDVALAPHVGDASGLWCCLWGSILKFLRNTYIIYCIYTTINRFKSLCGGSVYGCLSLVSIHLTNNTDLRQKKNRGLDQLETSRN